MFILEDRFSIDHSINHLGHAVTYLDPILSKLNNSLTTDLTIEDRMLLRNALVDVYVAHNALVREAKEIKPTPTLRDRLKARITKN